MINTLLEAVRNALVDEFGGGCEVFMEEQSENVRPSFFIQWLSTAQEPSPGNQYLRQNTFCVRYDLEHVGVQEECGAVADRMFWCLEAITVGDVLIRGTKLRCERKEGTLDFYATYDCSVYRTEDIVSMGNAAVEIAVKGGGQSRQH